MTKTPTLGTNQPTCNPVGNAIVLPTGETVSVNTSANPPHTNRSAS